MEDKLNVLSCLINSSKEELKYIFTYKDRKEEVISRCEENKNNDELWEWAGNNRTPSKQMIKDNLKMIRRISLELEKELDQKYKWGMY